MILGYYLEFDFFIKSLLPALGRDSQAYKEMGEEYARTLSGGDFFSFENSIYSDRMVRAGSYVTLVGLIFYFFDFSLTLAIGINIFLVISYSILLYILLYNIYNKSIAKTAMYCSAFIPSIFINELGLFKDIFVTFSFMALLLLSYKIVNKKRKIDLLILVLFIIILVNLRFYYLAPILFYFGYYYFLKEMKFRRILVMIVMLTAFVIYSPKIISIGFGGNLLTNLYYHGYDIDIYSNGRMLSGNKITLANPFLLFTVLLNNPEYFLNKFLKSLLIPWTFPRIYYIPGISFSFSGVTWFFYLINYISVIIRWMFLFIGLNGLYKVLKNQDSAIIWIPMLIVPVIVSAFTVGTPSRYLSTLFIPVFACYAVGFEDKKNVKQLFLLSSIISILLILFFNRQTAIFEASLITFAIFIGYKFFNRYIKNWKSFLNTKSMIL